MDPLLVIGVALLAFGIMLLIVGVKALRQQRQQPEQQPGQAAPESGRPAVPKPSLGRDALRVYRHVNDLRAAARGPGALGKRIARRAIFRGIRKL